MSHNGSEIEARLRAVPSNEAAATPRPQQVPVPVALALGVFGVVEGACQSGVIALTQMQNPEAAAVLDSIREELFNRGRAMVLEATRRVQPATADQVPTA